MKKLIVLILSLTLVSALVGCSNTKQAEVETYSINGAHDYFTISNGSLVFSDTEELFDGGDLKIIQSDVFNEVISYSTTFYSLINGEREPILSNSLSFNNISETVNIEGDLGKISSKDGIINNNIESIDELKDNLWFELKTTDLNNKENVYQIQLTMTNK